jgi:hypothetical protein
MLQVSWACPAGEGRSPQRLEPRYSVGRLFPVAGLESGKGDYASTSMRSDRRLHTVDRRDAPARGDLLGLSCRFRLDLQDEHRNVIVSIRERKVSIDGETERGRDDFGAGIG